MNSLYLASFDQRCLESSDTILHIFVVCKLPIYISYSFMYLLIIFKVIGSSSLSFRLGVVGVLYL